MARVDLTPEQRQLLTAHVTLIGRLEKMILEERRRMWGDVDELQKQGCQLTAIAEHLGFSRCHTARELTKFRSGVREKNTSAGANEPHIQPVDRDSVTQTG